LKLTSDLETVTTKYLEYERILRETSHDKEY